MELSKENSCERLKMDDCDEERSEKFTHSSNLPSKFQQFVLSILLMTVFPVNVASNDSSCGINRFNNESPLTERIVGGNNSLQ